MGENWKHYAKWKKPDTKAIWFQMILFTWTVQNMQIHKESRLMIARVGRGKGEEQVIANA